MKEVFAMGSYGLYIWSAYAIVVLVCALNGCKVRWQYRKICKSLEIEQKRQAS